MTPNIMRIIYSKGLLICETVVCVYVCMREIKKKLTINVISFILFYFNALHISYEDLLDTKYIVDANNTMRNPLLQRDRTL